MSLKFRGCGQFRLRLLLATLTGKAIRIDQIRPNHESPGLKDYEASFLRLLEKLTDGCVVEIDVTGTSMRYKPGLISGGSGVFHDCPTTRGMSYFLEPVVLLGLFAKKPLSITLRGVSNHPMDPSIDVFRTVTLPLLKKLGVEDGLMLKVVSRGAPPLGGGEVQLQVPNLKRPLEAIKLIDEGMVRRVRGVSYSMKVSPQNTNRMVDGCRGVLNQLLADVYVFTDAASGKQSGASPGFGIMLVAETTTGCLLGAECCAGQEMPGAPDNAQLVPEDLGKLASHSLLEQISSGGVVDSTHQPLLLMMCALGPEVANQCRLGPLTPQTIHTLRHIKDFLGITFAIRPEPESKTIFLTCLGAGLKNLSRKVA